MFTRVQLLALVYCSAAVAVAGASLKLPMSISSHMVLQRAPAEARLWGWATAGNEVSVVIDGDSSSTTAAADGTWVVSLPPFEAGGPYEVNITDGVSTLTLTDVMFGDVFMCSGQSNMEFTVSQGFNSSAELADSINYPNLRMFAVAEKYSQTPQTDVSPRTSSFQWAVSSPTTVGGGAFQYFSAVCYFYGRDIYVQLGGKVPIGLIDTSYGGTCIEAWSSPDIVSQCTSSHSSMCYNSGTPSLTQYSCLYNAMLHPLLNFSITAFLWYQGEQNMDDPEGYECRVPMFVQDIRDKFEVPDLPFIYVDVTPGYNPDIRGAQQAALTKPHVYHVVTIDIGDPASPYMYYHPRNKQTVGSRMARIGMHVIYNQTGVTYLGPQPATVTSYSSGSAITFDITMDSSHLKFNDTAECVECCAKAKDVFQVSDVSGALWTNATGYSLSTSTPGHITITTNLASATAVRFDWTAYPSCYLYDTVTMLPTAPFEVTVSPAQARRTYAPHAHARRVRHHLPAHSWSWTSMN